jgi:heme/copper-type cytochrome/quinol oxidase subunit 2
MEPEEDITNTLPGLDGDSINEKIIRYKWALIGGGVVLIIIIIAVVTRSSQHRSNGTENGTNGTVPTEAILQVIPTPTLTVEMRSAIEEAKQSAQEYMDLQTELRTDYPWLRRLPLATEKYFVFYDLQLGKFIGEIHFQEGDDVEQLKIEAINALKNLKGIPADDFEFEWTINR